MKDQEHLYLLLARLVPTIVVDVFGLAHGSRHSTSLEIGEKSMVGRTCDNDATVLGRRSRDSDDEANIASDSDDDAKHARLSTNSRIDTYPDIDDYAAWWHSNHGHRLSQPAWFRHNHGYPIEQDLPGPVLNTVPGSDHADTWFPDVDRWGPY